MQHPYLSSEKDNLLGLVGFSMNLDGVDRKILRELQEDARASFREMSSRIHVSTPTISARVGAMQDVGLIRGYSVRLDADMLGQASAVLLIEARPSDLDAVVEKIQDQDLVRTIHVLSDSRIMCIISFYSHSKYSKFVESLSRIPEITKVSTSTVMKTPKEESRAALTDEAGLMVKCYYCGHMMKDEGIRIKLDGKYHYLCCSVCEKMYREKYEKLKKSAQVALVK